MIQRRTRTSGGDCYAGAHPDYRYKVRVVTETAWHSLFVHHMFRRPTPAEHADFQPDYVILNAPNFNAVPEIDGTRSSTFIIPDFHRRLVLIGGTSYAGEIKKSVFTLLNYLYPLRGVLPMHCSANVGPGDDVALFFGLSATGKTTLSADPGRKLVGDDEHGWSDQGIFNFEAGCYAKTIRLSAEHEPEIYGTTRRFGTILENVGIDAQTRVIDLDDETLTENTRGAYPLSYIPRAVETGVAGHPRTILFLTCDAFGIMPPIARLDEQQTMYHFLAGYTAKVAGTESGIVEPQATFSTCFGAPFMVRYPSEYAGLLRRKIREHGSRCWLVNTGWSGGPYGEGKRMPIQYTRALVNAAIEGRLDDVPTRPDPVFGFQVPERADGIPQEILDPRRTWSDPAAYDRKARELAELFTENYKQFTGDIAREVAAAGPKV